MGGWIGEVMHIWITIIIWMVYFLSLYFSVVWLLTFLEVAYHPSKNSSLKKYPYVSILVPAHNEESNISRAITSLLKLDYPKNRYELIIIDDGSTDSTATQIKNIIKKNPKYIIQFLQQKPSGKAAALNYGLKEARGEFFACLDADSRVERHALKAMLQVFEKNDENLAIVTPCMQVEKPENLLQKFQRIEYIMAIFLQRLMGHMDCMYIAPGPFSLYRKEVIMHLGGFDEHNLTEDQEIAYRMQKYHYRLKQCPDAMVYTLTPKKWSSLYKQRNRWFKGSLVNLIKYRTLFFNKKYGDFGVFQMPLNLLNFIISIASLMLVIYFMVLPFIKLIRHLIVIRFDIMPYFTNTVNISFNILNLDLGKFFVFQCLFALMLFFFYLAHRALRVRIREHGLWYLVPYFFAYYLVLSFIALVVLIEVSLGRRQRW